MGLGRPVPERPDRMGDLDDLSGRFGRRRAEHARIADRADGRFSRASVADLLADPASGHSRHRPQGRRDHPFGPASRRRTSASPLAGSLIPWIDVPVEGRPVEGRVEGRRRGATRSSAVRRSGPIPIDGLCVRIGAMRCHSQALTIKLKKDVPLDEISDMLAKANPWAKGRAERSRDQRAQLTPAAVTGTLTVPVGRLRKMAMGPEYLAAFTCGDQLLWGAAEPLRRMLRILLEA